MTHQLRLRSDEVPNAAQGSGSEVFGVETWKPKTDRAASLVV